MENRKKKIIGFSGRLLSGKTIISKALCEKYDGEIITVAESLKKLVCNMRPTVFTDISDLNRLKRSETKLSLPITDDDIRFISEQTKTPLHIVETLCKKKSTWENAREILQFIGTEIIRAYNPSWHVERLKENINNSSHSLICVDDVRFPNERNAIEELGGECFFVIRPQTEVVSNHLSETSLRWQDFNAAHIVLNESTEKNFTEQFIKLFEEIPIWNTECPILLTANEYYKKHNVNFGYNSDDDEKELVHSILEQNKKKVSFKTYGVIDYYTTNFTERTKFSTNVLNTGIGIEYSRNRFILYNPLIYENLKFYL